MATSKNQKISFLSIIAAKENGISSIKYMQVSFSLVGQCFITCQPFWVIQCKILCIYIIKQW